MRNKITVIALAFILKMLCPTLSMAWTQIVSVVDDDDRRFVNCTVANITKKSKTPIVVTTNRDGIAAIPVSKGDQLKISYPGFEDAYVAVKEGQTIRVRLIPINAAVVYACHDAITPGLIFEFPLGGLSKCSPLGGSRHLYSVLKDCPCFYDYGDRYGSGTDLELYMSAKFKGVRIQPTSAFVTATLTPMVAQPKYYTLSNVCYKLSFDKKKQAKSEFDALKIYLNTLGFKCKKGVYTLGRTHVSLAVDKKAGTLLITVDYHD